MIKGMIIILCLLISGCYGSSSTNSTGLYKNETQYIITPDGLIICLPDDDITICF